MTHSQVAGWAKNSAAGARRPLTLAVLVDGREVGRVRADQPRDDLIASGVGAHAFFFTFTPRLSAAPHSIDVHEVCSGTPLTNSPCSLRGSLEGSIDIATRNRVLGWAQNTADPASPVSIVVAADGQPVGRVLANTLREDLAAAGIGTGRNSFEFVFEPPLSLLRHTISLVCEASGASLPGSPCVVEASNAFDATARVGIIGMLDSFHDEAGLDERLEFLASQVARLLRERSDRRSRRGERLAARQFRRRWMDPAAVAKEPELRRRALLIDATMPEIGRDAGSAAIVSHALSLQRLGYDVVLAPADMGRGAADALEALNVTCCHMPWFASIEEVLRAEGGTAEIVYLHRVSCAFPYMALVRRYAPRARIVFSVADLHHVRMYRQAIAEDRPELKRLAAHVRAQELWSAAQADVVITHSDAEAAMLRKADPSLQPCVIPWAVPLRPGLARFDDRLGLAFIGNYKHSPNRDSAQFLIDEIMPLVWQQDPSVHCHLAGSAMPATLRRPRPGVIVHGRIDDLAGLLNQVRLTVAPLTYGAGIKGKVLDSLAAGTPCICTPIAAEGIKLGHSLKSLVADSAAGLAAAILRLQADPALHAECVREGLATITSSFSESRIDQLMQAAIQPP